MTRSFRLFMAILALAGATVLLGRSVALADPDGLEVSKSGSGLLVRLINPKDGASSARSSYAVDAADCAKQSHPCYIFFAINGTAPLPARSDVCMVQTTGNVPTAYCAADGISSITVEAVRGGTIGFDASGDSEMGKHCMPATVTYKAGGGVYSVLAHDGCHQIIVCADASFGTVDADSGDAIQGKCKFVQRH
ncbi:MAG TPA: hypothetical protein VHT05_01785 [Candidatus Elarobacter sp.]|nr:hypothetical protein [Candidatus Elarobacter sp.]